MPKSYRWDVTASVTADGVTSSESLNVKGLDPDDACGAAAAQIIGQFGEDASYRLMRVIRIAGENSDVMV
jgi:hypothetical protein